MSFSHALPAAAARDGRRQAAPPRDGALFGPAAAVELLVRCGALLSAIALTAFLVLRHIGPMNLDAMTLLPAATLVGAAAMSLGVALACLQALRDV